MFHVVPNRFALSAGLVISVGIRAIFPAVVKARLQLHKALLDTYRPELHYMRGPGPKWLKKHGALLTARRSTVVQPAYAMRMLSSRRSTCSALTEVTAALQVLK